MDNFPRHFSSTPNRSNLIDDILGINNSSDNNYGFVNNSSGLNYEQLYHGIPNIDQHLRLRNRHRHLMNFGLAGRDTQNMNRGLFANPTLVPATPAANVGNHFANPFNHNFVSQVKQEPSWTVPTSGLSNHIGSNHTSSIGSSSNPTNVHVESTFNYLPVPNRPDLTRVAVTETITKHYVTTIPTTANTNIPTNTNIVSVQNDIERVKRALAKNNSQSNVPIRSSQPTIPVFDIDAVTDGSTNNQSDEILDATPLNILPPLDHDQDHKQPIEHSFEDNNNVELDDDDSADGDDDEDDHDGKGRRYDGRTHSLPCEKFGPYTCPRCEMVFETSQKFAAHMLGAHYRFESQEQRKRRLRARYRKRRRALNDISRRTVTLPERGETSTGHNGPIKTEVGDEEDGILFDVVVKQEPTV